MTLSRDDLKKISPKELRGMMRTQTFKDHTIGVADGYVQANLVILPRKYAFEFLVFCQRNPKPCPILEVTDPGVAKLSFLSKEADLRSDISQYRVFRNGECIDEPFDLSNYWREDLVSFLLGCSATLDHLFVGSNLTIKHIARGEVPSVFTTNIECKPAGIFRGPLVVTLRPIKKRELVQVVQLSSRYPLAHGTPAHIGDPIEIGIEDIGKNEYGHPTQIDADEVPAFWACGVTPQRVCLIAKPDLMITHYPAKMFVSDQPIAESAIMS